MKNNFLILLSVLSSLALSIVGCNNQEQQKKPNPIDEETISYDGINLYYNSSDDSMNEFLNDFTHRNMRYDSMSCGEFKVTNGTGFAKNWESMAVTFQNAVKQVYREDKIQNIANYLISSSQDSQGLIYNTPLVNEPAFSEAGDDRTGYCIPQGWPFPNWKQSVPSYFDEGNVDACRTADFNFNDSWYEEAKNWQVENGTFVIPDVDPDGYGHFATNGRISSDLNFMFHKDDLKTLLRTSKGIDPRYAPIIDIEIAFEGTNIKDYNIIFKFEGDASWHRAPQSLYASTPLKNLDGYVHVRQFFDMYLNSDWNQIEVDENNNNKKTIVALGVEFVGKDGATYQVNNGLVNYIRPAYDTRQSNATYQWILALYNYFIYTRDIGTLNKLMDKARRGLLFLTHALEGEKGLLCLKYLYGHDGVTPYSINEYDRLAYHGVGNGYWDLTVSPMYNLEANTYFYQALRAMAVLEEAMLSVENDNKAASVVKNRIPGEEEIVYNYDTDSLNALADLVKSNMERDVEVVEEEYDGGAGDYHYQNKGGFYNPKTGRFVIGINENTGEVLDYGFLYLNLEAVCAGIGTPIQQLSIMNWIDGKRIVTGDTSTGSDIYFYEFAPRYCTVKCDEVMGFSRDINHYDRFYKHGYDTWSRQVQNGGAVIAWSYYDLVARSKVFGVQNAVERLEKINKWYQKVLANGGRALNFYGSYYDKLNSQAYLEDKNMYYVYSVQAAGTRGVGALGLDAEFIESVILIRAIPDALFGMDATKNNNLTFTYGDNNSHDFFEIYNMKYGDAVYSIRSKKNVMELFNINGIAGKDHLVTFKYKTNDNNLTIKVNGEIFKNTVYEGGYAYVTVPFDNVKVIFG